MTGSCLSCERLGRCSETDPEKVAKNYVCVRYEETARERVLARVNITNQFGSAGIKALVALPKEEA